MSNELNNPDTHAETRPPMVPETEPEIVPEREPDESEILEVHPQDSFHRIFFGQVEEPLFPAPNPPSDTPEDDLTRAALNDPAAHTINIHEGPLTLWRLMALVLLVVVALAIVFWKH